MPTEKADLAKLCQEKLGDSSPNFDAIIERLDEQKEEIIRDAELVGTDRSEVDWIFLQTKWKLRSIESLLQNWNGYPPSKRDELVSDIRSFFEETKLLSQAFSYYNSTN